MSARRAGATIGSGMEWAERRAAAILESVPDYVWDGETVPVPVEDIVDSVFGLYVRNVDDMTAAPECPPLADGESLSGLLLANSKQIWCNAGEGAQWPGRKRFTICHELGHWVLHKPGQDSLFCRRGSVVEGAERPPLPEIEEEANAFAAALLMPPALVERWYRKTGGDHARMCELFGASGSAMGKRMHAVI